MFTPIDARIWRGPRPEAFDFDAVRKKFSYVVSLEGQQEDDKEAIELSPAIVLSYPISVWDIYVSGISQNYLNSILAFLKLPFERPVLVHCQHGQDRTGLIIAAYRVVASGWTKPMAMDEAITSGYKQWANFGLNKTWANFSGSLTGKGKFGEGIWQAKSS